VPQIQKSISLDERVWFKIEKLRGNLPRSRFVGKIISNELGKLN